MAEFQLNEAQRNAVNDTEGAILVIAGAGSGKTRVLTARICNLIDSGVDPYNILAITFTNKAAKEMKERIMQSNPVGQYVWACTFHSMCAKILRMHIKNLGYTENFTIYTELESDRVVKRICADYPASDPKKHQNYLWHISRAKTLGMSPDEYYGSIKDYETDSAVIATIYRRYEDELKKSNSLDFDDLLVKTVRLFNEFPDVLAIFQRRFKYIHVDEFQDTNSLQFDIVKKLAGGYGNLFAVGDEDQLIYSWRGAEIRNILDFGKSFPNSKFYKLEQNYRSTDTILKCANNVIKNNNERNEKTLWSGLSDSSPVELYEAYSDRDEVAHVVRRIDAYVRQGGSYKDNAILVRANSLTRLFEEELNLHSIPYKVFGGFRFFERKEIKDALAYVRLVLNPSDNDSFLRVVNYPKRGIGGTCIEEIAASGEKNNLTYLSVLDNKLDISAATIRKTAPFIDIYNNLSANIQTMQPAEYMEYLIAQSGIEYSLSSSNDAEDSNRLENVKELVSAVTQFVNDNPGAGISDFMQSVALVSDSDEMDENNYVTLATIHAVKGLEFENVFVVGAEESIFPSVRALNTGSIEEERRLMYVALTRAKRRLMCSYARSRFRFGETVYLPKCRFLEEMKGEQGSVSILESSSAPQKVAKPSDAGNKQYGAHQPPQKTFVNKANFGVKTGNSGKNNFNEYQKNTLVEHNKYGRGIIISIDGNGDDKTASIAFKGLGVKRFSLAIAANMLKIIKE